MHTKHTLRVVRCAAPQTGGLTPCRSFSMSWRLPSRLVAFCCSFRAMRTYIIGTVLISMATIAFGQGDVLDKTLMHEGVERTYKLYVPSTYPAKEATPLVLRYAACRATPTIR